MAPTDNNFRNAQRSQRLFYISFLWPNASIFKTDGKVFSLQFWKAAVSRNKLMDEEIIGHPLYSRFQSLILTFILPRNYHINLKNLISHHSAISFTVTTLCISTTSLPIKKKNTRGYIDLLYISECPFHLKLIT